MSTRGELIVQALIAAAKTAAHLAGRVERDRSMILASDSLPGAVVREEYEDAPHIKNTCADRELNVAIEIMDKGASARASIDTVRAQLHRAVWDDATLGGLALSLAEGASEWSDEQAEETVYSLTLHYRVGYRTMANDLELTG